MKWLRCFCVACVVGAGAVKAEPSTNVDVGSGTLMVIVNESGNPQLREISVSTLRKIFTCQITSWRDVPGSSRTDEIHVFRQDDEAPATQAFKARVGAIQFGPCLSTLSGPKMNEIMATGLGRVPPNSKVRELVQGIGYLTSGPRQEGTRILRITDKKKKRAASLADGHPG